MSSTFGSQRGKVTPNPNPNPMSKEQLNCTEILINSPVLPGWTLYACTAGGPHPPSTEAPQTENKKQIWKLIWNISTIQTFFVFSFCFVCNSFLFLKTHFSVLTPSRHASPPLAEHRPQHAATTSTTSRFLPSPLWPQIQTTILQKKKRNTLKGVLFAGLTLPETGLAAGTR